MVQAPMCPHCGEPLGGAAAMGFVCSYCAESKYYDFARSACLNVEPVTSLILQYKYGNRLHLASTLAELMVSLWETSDDKLNGNDWILVPVPLYWKKLKKRGFNQAEELACFLSKRFGFPLVNALKRKNDSVNQASLGRQERVRHAKGLYYVNPVMAKRGVLDGRRVLLIDDIMTTGSTVEACAAALKKEGRVSCVGVLSLARTPQRYS